MKAVILRIHLLQPLLVTRPGAGEENSSEAYSFIPGGVVRGALINRYLEMNPSEDISYPEKDKPRPFFDGSCKFLNGYPMDSNGKRALPCPLSWRIEKNTPVKSSLTVYDFAKQEKELAKPSGLSKDFAQISGNNVELINSVRVMLIHNASNKRGIKRANDSFVYRYEALAEGQVFEAMIIGEGSHTLCNELNLQNGDELFLGGSRSANYGRTKLIDVVNENNWQETERNKEVTEEIILTLLSDTIITGTNGQPALSPDHLLNNTHHSLAFIKTSIVGGFNRRWGLQLPQSQAIKAGSVFVYPKGSISEDQQKNFQENGIGERTNEGFGRVAINWQGKNYYNENNNKLIQIPESPLVVPKLTQNNSIMLAKKMAERQMRAQLERKLAHALSRLSIEFPPQSSQLSRLRSAARMAMQLQDLAVIQAHVVSLKTAANQLEHARVIDKEGEPAVRLNEWLKAHVDTSKQSKEDDWTIWKKYLEPKSDNEVKVAGETVSEEVLRQFKVEFTARLLDSLFRKTTRKNQEEQEKPGGINGSSME